MTCMKSDIQEILTFRGTRPETRAIVALLKRDIVERPLGEMLDADRFPLTMRQFETITSGFAESMDWEKVLLLLKIGLFVSPAADEGGDDRERVAEHIVDNYCEWIGTHGGLWRLLPKKFWAR